MKRKREGKERSHLWQRLCSKENSPYPGFMTRVIVANPKEEKRGPIGRERRCLVSVCVGDRGQLTTQQPFNQSVGDGLDEK